MPLRLFAIQCGILGDSAFLNQLGKKFHGLASVRITRFLPALIVLFTLLITISTLDPHPAQADSGLCAIPGNDGPGGTLSGIINTYYPGTASVGAGATTIPVGPASGAGTGISAGDLLLVMQMQDAAINSSNTGAYGDGSAGDPATGSTDLNNSGRYEYVVATGPVSGGSVPIQGAGAGSGLIYSYTNADFTATQGQRRYQVIRVPQYSSATLSSGLTALRWNGQVGGVLALDVAGETTLGGTVDLSGFGFRGGGGRQDSGDPGFLDTDYRTPWANEPNGSKGEGIAGTPRLVYSEATGSIVDTGVEGYPNGAMARGAPGNAGGGGTDGRPTANDENTGGGGGGNGGTGGKGGYAWRSIDDSGGFGGLAFAASPSRLTMGGGGGAGTRNNTPGVPTASSGAAGGGLAFIRSGTVSGTGSIVVDGSDGIAPANDGGGGGGAGGTVLLLAESGGLGGLTVSAQGGDGGDAWPTQAPGGYPGARHGPGGGGGGGVILLSAAATGTNVSGGINGTSTTALDPYGAQPGNPGIVRTNVVSGELPTAIAGAPCIPTLTTVKTTSTPNITNTPTGTSATYTIEVANAAGLGTAINLSISDTLPVGFTYASTDSVTLGGGATRPSTNNPIAGDANPTWGSFSIPGGGLVSITFTVDVASTVPNGTYQNPALATYSDPTRTTPGGTTSAAYDPASSTGEDVNIGTPTLVDPKVAVDINGTPTFPGDTIEYQVTISNTSAVDALGATYSDSPDPNTTLIVGSVTTSVGTVTTGNTLGDTSVAIDIGTIGPGITVAITYRVTVNDPLPPGVTEVANQGLVSGINFPDTPTFDPSTPATDDPTIVPITTIAGGAGDALPDTGFAPGRVSAIPPQPLNFSYTPTGGLQLHIPRLGLDAPIVGVPTSWDVSWLADQIGYLGGTAFPTWTGNTGLTGHAYLADGTPGPFAQLGEMKWGDVIQIDAFGQQYTYAVRDIRLVRPENTSVLSHEDYDWITLITCMEFSEYLDAYRYRLIVRAVLIQVEPLN
jgi:LPXTG-site transpeptidase (sortase) family protein